MKVNKFNSHEKIYKHMDKLDYFFNGHKTLIVTELDLTNRCNNNCPYCIGKNDNKASLNWNQIKRIVNDLEKLENKGIILSGGGEPLLHPFFNDVLKYIKEHGMKIGLNSNGLALNKEKSENILKFCEYFRISLDAGTPEMYNKTHGMAKKYFEKVLDNIKDIIEIRDDIKSNTSIGTGFLTSEKTKSDMENFVKISKELNLDFAQFRPFLGDFTDITEKYYFLKDKYEDDNFKVVASTHKYNKFNDEIKRPYNKCRGMFFSTVITADAKIYACIHHRQNDKYLIGNIKDKSLCEIWKSSKKISIYENIDFEDCPYFCRNDNFNRTLNLLDSKIVHPEFL